MLLFAAAAVAAGTPATRPTVPIVVAEASATVRVVSGVRLKLDSPTNGDAPPAHDSKVNADGRLRSARLIEFE